MPTSAEDPVYACESRIINAWPALDTLVMGDWVVRLAGGYSGRANSASPLRQGARMDETLLGAVIAVYRRAGIVPSIRLTPLADPAMGPMLMAHGFVVRDESLGMIAPLTRPVVTADPADVTIRTAASACWVRGVSALQTGSKRDADAALMAIVGRIRMPASFISLAGPDGRAVAYGVTVVERGMAELGSIVVAPEQRGRGYGRRLVSALLQQGAEAGARQAFLQVESGNAAAIRLYSAFGFREAYRYRTLLLSGRDER